MKFLKDFDVKEKRVLVRCDFNVPLAKQGEILDDSKIKDALPTLNYLREHQAKIIIITHLGEPEGLSSLRGAAATRQSRILNLDNVKNKLEELLGIEIAKTNDCIGKEVVAAIENMNAGEFLLLENVRFHKEETENDLAFAKELASLGDIYINEAFDVCHRAHASVTGIPQFLPHGAGLALQKEVEVLHHIMEHPKRPMVAIIGGAKVATKAAFVDGFCAFADLVIVNGLIKQELIAKKIPLVTPEKVFGPKDNLDGLDLSPQDTERIVEQILHAKTIFWNGPFGKFEEEQYKKGTLAIANAIIKSGAFSVVGGGETIAFLHQEGMLDKFSHVSTAGGAMLEFLSGQELPGLKALE